MQIPLTTMLVSRDKKFEYSSTPLAARGVGMYIDEDLHYTVIEKAAENAFQALWIEIQFPKQANVTCGVVYRQHNTPERFLEYFDQTLEKISASGKPISVYYGRFQCKSPQS